jgi:hypothetical protein
MPDWQERITHETAPAIRVEHELRYRVAAPLILAGGPWADLGCGNGLAAAAALNKQRPSCAVLADLDGDVASQAAQQLRIARTSALAADLTSEADLRRIGEALLAFGGEPIVTCFEVVEHLTSFLQLLEWSREFSRDHGATFVMSVPNDAFWSIQNPHHRTMWGEGAFAELCELLPVERTLMRQVAISGSAMLDDSAARVQEELPVWLGGDDAVATHFVASFGPRHGDLGTGALAVQAAMLEQRRWERQREVNVALAQAEIAKQRAEFDDWRRYIHELERELGRPLSGEAQASSEPREAGPQPTSVDSPHRSM